jgi:hypothetical protein
MNPSDSKRSGARQFNRRRDIVRSETACHSRAPRLVAGVGLLLCTVTATTGQDVCPALPIPVDRVVASSAPGTLMVATLPAFPLPGGVVTTIDGGLINVNGFTQHLTIPPGGFDVPAFCLPALGFTAAIAPLGCESGSAHGEGIGWADGAPCPDPEVFKVGDTSAPPCATLGGGCNTGPGGAGSDSLGDVDTVRGGTFPGDPGPCTVEAPGVHLQFDVPVHMMTWIEGTASLCPDPDGVFDPGTDTLISESSFIFSPTTDQAGAAFIDKNGDSCAKAGSGPTGPVTLVGSPVAGPGCVVGQSLTLVAAGPLFTGGAPVFDMLYRIAIPKTVISCEASPGADTCILTSNPCMD